MTYSDPQRPIAQFPTCPDCGAPIIERVSDAAICVQVRDGPVQTFRRSEAAAYLRFVAGHAPNGVVAQHLYHALGECINISRVIDTLRRRLGGRENVPCDRQSKATCPGRFYGVYYLPEHVKVWEPTKKAGGGNEK